MCPSNSRGTLRIGGLEVPTCRIGFIRIMILSYGIVLVQVSQRDEGLNLRNKTDMFLSYEQWLKVTEATTFKKKIPKLNYKHSISYNNC